MAKKKCPECPPGAPLWMTTFSDMVTLLLAFFVMLLSFSSIQESKFQDAVHSLQGAFGVLSTSVSVIAQPEVVMPNADSNEWQQMLYELQQVHMVLAEEGLADDVQLELKKDGVSVLISTPLLFEPAKADLKPTSLPVLAKLAEAFRKLDAEVRVEGHTDNVPISSEQFPSNWELSAARAMAVLKYLLVQGLPPERLAAVGYGEFRPVAPNDTEEGRRANRRVEIFVRRNAALASSVQGEATTETEEVRRGG